MICNLTNEDCAEIYQSLGCAHIANLQARIGFDGEALQRATYIFSGATPRPSSARSSKNVTASFMARTTRFPER